MNNSSDPQPSFSWHPQPEAAEWIDELLEQFCKHLPVAEQWAGWLYEETGTRLIDWIDYFAPPAFGNIEKDLSEAGFIAKIEGEATIWRHPEAMFPPVVLFFREEHGIALRVDSVVDFLDAHGICDSQRVEGDPLAALRRVVYKQSGDCHIWAVERHGYAGFTIPKIDSETVAALLRHDEAIRLRPRHGDDTAALFSATETILRAAVDELGADRACDLFFINEREYWQCRNQAGSLQKQRQDTLGLGWGNHDHHTYRSSREHFARLIGLLEILGFSCRERFYAGKEAGWGAQVLEQETCGIVVFADVDLADDEVADDFSHEELSPQGSLGTVGLWCRLHGEAFLGAGMHHLECQFDFDAARDQLAVEGMGSMPPFTDLPHLKQCFTEGEMWAVEEDRLRGLVLEGHLTEEEAATFQQEGAIGSHLEILERNDGYKGFNQTGISDIIRKTDPRRVQSI